MRKLIWAALACLLLATVARADHPFDRRGFEEFYSGGLPTATAVSELDNLVLWHVFDAGGSNAFESVAIDCTDPVEANNDHATCLVDASGQSNDLVAQNSGDWAYWSTVQAGYFFEETFPSVYELDSGGTTFLDNDGATAFSCFLVIKVRSTNNYDYLSKRADDADASAGWSFVSQPTSGLEFVVSDGSGLIKVDGTALSTSTDYMIGFSWDGTDASGVALYINGAADGGQGTTTDTLSGSATNAVEFNVGGIAGVSVNGGGDGSVFKEWGCTTDVITAAEFLSIYNNYWKTTYSLP